MPLVSETNSKFKVCEWVERLVKLLKEEERGLGPAFCNKAGNMLSYGWLNDLFIDELKKVQQTHTNLIESSIQVG